MTTFANAVNSPMPTTTTNGMAAFDKTGAKVLDLFSKIGSSRNNPEIVQTFMAAYGENPDLAMKCLFWARDVRGGAGERGVFRTIMRELSKVAESSVIKNLPYVPTFGRFDDLYESFDVGTNAYRQGIKVFGDALISASVSSNRKDHLVGKWADRKGPHAVALTKALGMSPKQYRNLIVAMSSTVEQAMCAKMFDHIEYSHVPSVAAGRYAAAFTRNDPVRYEAYKQALVKGETTINASVLFPYQVIKTLQSGDWRIGQAQWDALPDYMTGKRVLPMVDVSGSMDCSAGGSATCLEVALSLGLYCSDKNKGGFKDLILTFSSEPQLMKLEGDLSVKLAQLSDAKWEMNTNIELAFQRILEVARINNVPAEEMPEVMLILSDMQFDQCAKDPSASMMQMLKQQYANYGYTLPGVVFWNLNESDQNTPTSASDIGTVLVSGFSPSILKAVLACDFDRITPETMMLDVLLSERYKDIVA